MFASSEPDILLKYKLQTNLSFALNRHLQSFRNQAMKPTILGRFAEEHITIMLFQKCHNKSKQ